MRLVLSSLATAALAMLASAAPTVVASEVTTDLPARFAMYVITEEARVNGLRVLFGEGEYPHCSPGYTSTLTDAGAHR